MFHLILMFFKILLIPYSSLKKQLFLTIALQKKEIEILKRSLGLQKKRPAFSNSMKRFFAFLLSLLPQLRSVFSLVTPTTVLTWYRRLVKRFWTFPAQTGRPGRPATPNHIKNLILSLKNDNLLWGVKRIQGELLKLGISLDKKTIASIVKDFRRKGKIKSGTTWRSFLQSHLESLFACDFFTVDSLFNRRFYVFFIIHLKTRRIVHTALTRHPVRQFVRQSIISFSENRKGRVYLIHDRSPELNQRYPLYNITGIATSVEAPNMNSFAERFVRSIRREALDNFIIFNEKQLRYLVLQYIDYYNSLRPHQGIGQRVPCGYTPQVFGTIVAKPILYGLHHHYQRIPA